MSVVTVLESLHRGEGDLFIVSFTDDLEVSFRLPSCQRAEQYQKLIDIADDASLKNMLYEGIFKECVDDDFIANFAGDIGAGVPESIARVILMLSGVDEHQFEYTEKILEVQRDRVKEFSGTMKRIICWAFPGYKFSDLSALNYQELVQVFCHAEYSLIERGIIQDRIEMIRPGQENQEKQVSLSELIKKDAKEYRSFDNERVAPQRPNAVNPAERAQKEEEKFRQAMIRKYSGRG